MMLRQGKWLALFVALPLLACGAGEPGEMPDAALPDVETLPEPEPAMPGEPTPDPMAMTVEQVVTITNNMPHEMVVFVVEDGERREIGRVDAEVTDDLVIEAIAGQAIELVATNDPETHSVDFVVDVGTDETPVWTLGGS